MNYVLIKILAKSGKCYFVLAIKKFYGYLAKNWFAIVKMFEADVFIYFDSLSDSGENFVSNFDQLH